jgi:hypothetical protein
LYRYAAANWEAKQVVPLAIGMAIGSGAASLGGGMPTGSLAPPTMGGGNGVVPNGMVGMVTGSMVVSGVEVTVA